MNSEFEEKIKPDNDNMIHLEEKINEAEDNAIEDVQSTIDLNYSIVENKIADIKKDLPYPEIDRYATSYDYDEIDALKMKKAANKLGWEEIDVLEKYSDEGSLFCGQVILEHKDKECMFTEKYLDSIDINYNDKGMRLINVDDKKWGYIVKKWMYPDISGDVTVSSKFSTVNRKIVDFNITHDNRDPLLKNINDGFLIKTLRKNKDSEELVSIIKTIQLNQNDIRESSVDNSLVVQGCAGSGKTMVLLHRLRYLFFNNIILNKDIRYLIPGNEYKRFINKIAIKFKIDTSKIVSYYDYYYLMCTKEKKVADKIEASELVFPLDYLHNVYSKKFLQTCYQEVFDKLNNDISKFIDIFEKQLTESLEFEKLVLEEQVQNTNHTAFSKVKGIIKEIESFVSVKIENNLENIGEFIFELRETLQQCQEKYDLALNTDVSIDIAENDDRIINDLRYIACLKERDTEKAKCDHASIFTRGIHKKKFLILQQQLEKLINKIKTELAVEERRKLASKTEKLRYVYENIQMEQCKEILGYLEDALRERDTELKTLNAKLADLDKIFERKHIEEINILRDTIEQSADLYDAELERVESLNPVGNIIDNIINKCIELYNTFKASLSAVELDKLQKNYPYLCNSSNYDFNSRLFNACKRSIFESYNLKLCDAYKHYWYLKLYCQFLTGNDSGKIVIPYIYIDEAQDLSVSELELIYKLNSTEKQIPVMNLFGDINQMITQHGVQSWADCPFAYKYYALQEDFRNTNEIIEYCNDKLDMDIKKVGVSMDPVEEYKYSMDASKKNVDFKSAVFIVKDEYAMADLEGYLKDNPCGIKCEKPKIFTVKSVKGLEFKYVIVYDRDMTRNEKYIAYTRALSKLIVIKILPKQGERISLIQQGEE